jgi:hypothetical protein
MPHEIFQRHSDRPRNDRPWDSANDYEPPERGQPRGVAQPDISHELKAVGSFEEAEPRTRRPPGVSANRVLVRRT